MESRGRRVHSIEKAIRLLDCFWEADSPLSLHELEQRTGWAKSTIHGLLATMLDSAVVEQRASASRSIWPACPVMSSFLSPAKPRSAAST